VTKPAREWTEEDVLSLPLEDDTLERKGSRMLDLTLSGVKESDVRDELAKQLSAFANTGGGRILYGVTDDGQVSNGGISVVIKGGKSPKDWLESVIPILTEYEVVGVNVYPVSAQSPGSAIQPGKSLYVVDIPDSERAPHQSKRDWRYYVRLGSTSQPAPHRLIEDIRNRARYPNLDVIHSELYTVSPQKLPDLKAQVSLQVRLTVKNLGRVKANNACILVEGGGRLAVQPVDYPLILKSRLAPTGVFWEWLHPIYPEMETELNVTCSLSVQRRPGAYGSTGILCYEGTDDKLDDLTLYWRIFADSAPPKSGCLPLAGPTLTQRIESRMVVQAGR